MQALPHHYNVKATGEPDTNLQVHVTNLANITVAPPALFGGPGDQWSPEDLFMASIVSCTILSFKAIARASNFSWVSIECNAQGILDKLDGRTQFTKVTINAKLCIASGESTEKAEHLLQKAEHACLISNSLKSEPHLECEVSVV